MKRRVLLTGRPGCGKTTLIKRIVNKLAQPVGGFYTEEMREAGTRVKRVYLLMLISKLGSTSENTDSTSPRLKLLA